MKIIDQLKKAFYKIFPKSISLATEKAGYVQKMASLSYNDFLIQNYFCCVLSTSKVKCLEMKLVFAIRYM